MVWADNGTTQNVVPAYLGIGRDGAASLPSFMCLDVSSFYVRYMAGNTTFHWMGGNSKITGMVSSFHIEQYENGYYPGEPTQLSRQSQQVPKITTGLVNITAPYYAPTSINQAIGSSSLSFSSGGIAHWVDVPDSSDGYYSARSGDEHYHIEHPKGEDTYGEERDPPLRPECLSFLRKYLTKRRELLAKRPDNEFLFPAFRDKTDGKLSTNSITKMVRWVSHDVKVNGLDIHICRRTYGQMLLDEGVPTDMVSVLMGHASTATTEKYYCRQKQQKASMNVRSAWGGNVPNPTPKSMPGAKNTEIDKDNTIPGYA